MDDKHQVIVNAQAFGAPQEHELLQPMIEGERENLTVIGSTDVFEKTKLTADSGFHGDYTERQIDLLRGIKKTFDPKGILNPGKIFDA